jgi:hypothetical protein
MTELAIGEAITVQFPGGRMARNKILQMSRPDEETLAFRGSGRP